MKEYLKVEATEQSIMITSGAQQALHLIVQCLLNPGDAVAFESPSHCYSLPLFQSAGIRIFHYLLMNTALTQMMYRSYIESTALK